jgi:hypothetical protein
MAGAGIKIFQSGERLTAAQVNAYLMDQVIARFADAATRDASFGGPGRPALTEGRFCYLDDVNEVQYYDGSVWQSAPQFAIEDDAVTTAKIANGAVTSAKIADGSIINIDISPSAEIAKTKISGTAITAADTGTVTSAMIADGTIINDDINASAAIAHSKLAGIAAGNVLLGDASSVPTATAITGDVTVSSSGVTAISSGVIVNADISTSAAVAHNKLANITAGQVLMGNASNVPTATAITGDVTVSSSGVTAIASGVIVNADISGSAAIEKTKISGIAITAADTGTVTSTILANDSVTQAKIADRAIGSAELDNLTLNAQNGTTYTLVLADAHKLVTLNNSSPITLTVPADGSVNFDIGDQVNILQRGTGQVTVSGAVGVSILAQGNKTKLNGQYSIATLIKMAAGEWVLVGNTSA